VREIFEFFRLSFVPDNWALEQLFPALSRFHKLNKCDQVCTHCDIATRGGIVDDCLTCTMSNPSSNYAKLEGEAVLSGDDDAYPGSDGQQPQSFGVPHEAHIHIGEDGYII